MKVVRLSTLRTGRLYPPGNIPGTYFCWRLSEPQGHSATGRIMSMKNSNDTIGNRTHDLPVCSTTAYPRPTEGKPKRWPSDAWFSKFLLSGDLKWMFSVHLEIPCRHCTRETDGTPLSPTTSDWGRLDDTSRNILPMLLQCVDLRAVIVLRWVQESAPPLMFLGDREFLKNVFLEQWLRRGGPTAWPVLFPDSYPSYFVSLGTSTVCCLCYRSQWCPEFGTTNTEWIWGDSYGRWYFPTSQAVNVQTCNGLFWSSRWTLRIFL